MKFCNNLIKKKHNSEYRLTENGKIQAVIAGYWISKNISDEFAQYFTSEYIRAMETAAYLNLPEASWSTELYLRERDRGILSNTTRHERIISHQDELRREQLHTFYWQPPGGESIANLCLRVEQIMKRLDHCGEKVIIVCHAGVMKALKRLIEGSYKQRTIRNAEIIWFSKRNPFTQEINAEYCWRMSVCPWLDSKTKKWHYIKPRQTYSNLELLAIVGNSNDSNISGRSTTCVTDRNVSDNSSQTKHTKLSFFKDIRTVKLYISQKNIFFSILQLIAKFYKPILMKHNNCIVEIKFSLRRKISNIKAVFYNDKQDSNKLKKYILLNYQSMYFTVHKLLCSKYIIHLEV